MREKSSIVSDLRNLALDRRAVSLMREDLSCIDSDMKKALPRIQREALEREKESLLSGMAATEHHISRVERLLSQLTPEERKVLEGMLISPYPGVVFDLATELGCESSRIYRVRSRALNKLIRLRYGAGAED